MDIKIIFKYDSGFLHIICDSPHYNEKVPSIVCVEQKIPGKLNIYSIGVDKENVFNKLVIDKRDINKFVFIDPFCGETFNDKVIGTGS